MQQFVAYLREIEELRFSKALLGTLSPLTLDHMLREECYYLTKLSQASETKSSDCDPAKPRVMEKI